MKKLIFVFLLLELGISSALHSQSEVSGKQAYSTIFNIGLGYGIETTYGDLKDRYGSNFEPTARVEWITRKNWIYGINGGFKLGSEVKGDPLSNLRVDNNKILGADHAFAEIYFRSRGMFIGGTIGKLFPIGGGRSGIRLSLSPGLIAHNTRIVDETQSLPQIEGQYLKGYDQLCKGMALKENISYQVISENRRVNFMIGLEFTQGFTKEVRSYNFATGLPTSSERRFDGYMGLKATWFLPFYNDDYIAPEIYY